MNVGKRATLANAIKVDDAMTRSEIGWMLDQDMSTRPKPKLPELAFTSRRLPDEMAWARQPVPMHVDE